jgi:hypothetical protein
MTNKTKKPSNNCNLPIAQTETRDAVENAIDKAKENKSATWESVNHIAPNRVSKWQERAVMSNRSKI